MAKMTTATITVPAFVLEKLEAGELERVGCMIRDFETKAVIYWLREYEPEMERYGGVPGQLAYERPNLAHLGVSATDCRTHLDMIRAALMQYRKDVARPETLVLSKLEDGVSSFSAATIADSMDTRFALAMDATSKLSEGAAALKNTLYELTDGDKHRAVDIEPFADAIISAHLVQAKVYAELGEFTLAISILLDLQSSLFIFVFIGAVESQNKSIARRMLRDFLSVSGSRQGEFRIKVSEKQRAIKPITEEEDRPDRDPGMAVAIARREMVAALDSARETFGELDREMAPYVDLFNFVTSYIFELHFLKQLFTEATMGVPALSDAATVSKLEHFYQERSDTELMCYERLAIEDMVGALS